MNAHRLLFASIALSVFASGCAHSGDRGGGDPSSRVLVAGSIGADGGTLRVDDGDQAGLQLVVPPGALATTTEVRILLVLEPRAMLVSMAPPSLVFRIEPAELGLAQLAVLRLPYQPGQVYETAPGNVVARTEVAGVVVDRPPVLVDVAAKVMTTTIDRFGSYRVVPGPVASLASYLPPLDDVVDLGDGVTFVAEAVPSGSPFATLADRRWRVEWPEGAQLLYFQGDLFVGREALLADRRETLATGVFVWIQGDRALPAVPELRPFVLEQPIGATPVAGTMAVYGAWFWDQPRLVVDQLFADTIRLRLSLGWSGSGIVVGNTDLEFVLGAGVGLLALVEDGIERTRQTP